jgi:hypothetical protein
MLHLLEFAYSGTRLATLGGQSCCTARAAAGLRESQRPGRRVWWSPPTRFASPLCSPPGHPPGPSRLPTRLAGRRQDRTARRRRPKGRTRNGRTSLDPEFARSSAEGEAFNAARERTPAFSPAPLTTSAGISSRNSPAVPAHGKGARYAATRRPTSQPRPSELIRMSNDEHAMSTFASSARSSTPGQRVRRLPRRIETQPPALAFCDRGRDGAARQPPSLTTPSCCRRPGGRRRPRADHRVGRR